VEIGKPVRRIGVRHVFSRVAGAVKVLVLAGDVMIGWGMDQLLPFRQLVRELN
jgi:hypothetical protein